MARCYVAQGGCKLFPYVEEAELEFLLLSLNSYYYSYVTHVHFLLHSKTLVIFKSSLLRAYESVFSVPYLLTIHLIHSPHSSSAKTGKA